MNHQQIIEFNDRVREAEQKTSLASWNAFAEILHVPSDLAPAVATNRPELVKLAPARALSVEECRVLYDFIAGMLRTNESLRQHAQELSKLAEHLHGHMKGLNSGLMKLDHFAAFRQIDEEIEDEIERVA